MSIKSHITRRTFLHTTAALAGALPMTATAQSNSVRPAPHMPDPHWVETNGLRMAVYEQGEGIPIVFSHGFPELAFSWRNQIKALSAAGYRCIAPDQRGYGLTGGPDDPKAYTIKHLCDDMAGLLDALGIDKAVFVGHDWGGAVVWNMARLHPARTLGVIGVNTPSQRPADLPPATPSEESLIVMGPNYYVATFQKPGQAESVLEADVRKTFEMLLRKGDIWNVEAFKQLPEDSPERQMDLLSMLKRDTFPGETFLPEDVMDYFVETFEATGFTGGLNWYRNIGGFAMLPNPNWRVNVPCLYVGAEHDVILRPSSADGMEDFISDLEKYTVMDCGHWTQQEKPEELSRVLIDWLSRKMKA